MVSTNHTSYTYDFMDCPYRGQTSATLAARGVPAIATYSRTTNQLTDVPLPNTAPSTSYVVTEDVVLG